TDLLVEVERDQGRSRVEDGAHGAHDRGEQSGHHQTDEADRQEVEDERGVSEIRFLDLVGEQSECDDAGQNQHKDRQDFQEAGEDGARFGVTFITSGEDALYDDLVGAPIPDAEYWGAEEDAGPGEVGVRGRLDHMEIIWRNHGAEVIETADARKTNNREGNGASDQDEGLHGVGVDDRGEATRDGVDSRGDYEDHGGFPERPAGDALEYHAGGVELDGNFGEDVGDDGDCRQVNGGLAIEAALEKFGHGEDVGTEIEGHKYPAEAQQDQAGQPLEMPDGESRGSAGAGETNEVLGGNIGDKQRR